MSEFSNAALPLPAVMATGRRLRDQDIAWVAQVVSADVLEQFALRFMGFSPARIQDLKVQHRGNVEVFKRDILYDWRNINVAVEDQRGVSNIHAKFHSL